MKNLCQPMHCDHDAENSLSLLKTIPKQMLRQQFFLPENPMFYGHDVWTAFELSWLNNSGKPEIAIAEFIIPCGSSQLLDSKSLKAYLNTFNMASFDSVEKVQSKIRQEMNLCLDIPIEAHIFTKNNFRARTIQQWADPCLDNYPLDDNGCYAQTNLHVINKKTTELSFCSDLLRLICFHTGNPLFGSIHISLTGQELDPISLLHYIISYRNTIFSPALLIEKMFYDIQQAIHPKRLLIEIRFNRQGGIGLSLFRSNINSPYQINAMLVRQ